MSQAWTEPSLPVLFAELPPEFEPHLDPGSPWTLLGEPLRCFLAGLASQGDDGDRFPGVHLMGEGIVVGKGTRIAPGVVIQGPAWIGRDVDIRPGAYLRGGVFIGDSSVVGANTEVKGSIFLPQARAPHLNYVGDSILGAGVNLGAGTVLSNFRHDGLEVRIPTACGKLATGRRKLGAVLGDGVMTGCNCVLHPGVIIGRDTHLYPGVQLRAGVYPASSLVKLRQETLTVSRR